MVHLGISDSVRLVGSIPESELIALLRTAELSIFPSTEEGFGLPVVEAAACGCPVIASTNTGASELITDGIEGFIVPISSPVVIADRLQQPADQPELLERIGQAALARVQELGGWDAYGDGWAKHIQLSVR